MVKVVEDQEDLTKELENAGDKLVVIDFFAEWCGPCKVISPFMDKLATEFPNVVFLKVNVDDCEDVAVAYKIEAMPTFKFIKKKQEIDDLTGASQDKLKEKVQAHA